MLDNIDNQREKEDVLNIKSFDNGTPDEPASSDNSDGGLLFGRPTASIDIFGDAVFPTDTKASNPSYGDYARENYKYNSIYSSNFGTNAKDVARKISPEIQSLYNNAQNFINSNPQDVAKIMDLTTYRMLKSIGLMPANEKFEDLDLSKIMPSTLVAAYLSRKVSPGVLRRYGLDSQITSSEEEMSAYISKESGITLDPRSLHVLAIAAHIHDDTTFQAYQGNTNVVKRLFSGLTSGSFGTLSNYSASEYMAGTLKLVGETAVAAGAVAAGGAAAGAVGLGEAVASLSSTGLGAGALKVGEYAGKGLVGNAGFLGTDAILSNMEKNLQDKKFGALSPDKSKDYETTRDVAINSLAQTALFGGAHLSSSFLKKVGGEAISNAFTRFSGSPKSDVQLQSEAIQGVMKDKAQKAEKANTISDSVVDKLVESGAYERAGKAGTHMVTRDIAAGQRKYFNADHAFASLQDFAEETGVDMSKMSALDASELIASFNHSLSQAVKDSPANKLPLNSDEFIRRFKENTDNINNDSFYTDLKTYVNGIEGLSFVKDLMPESGNPRNFKAFIDGTHSALDRFSPILSQLQSQVQWPRGFHDFTTIEREEWAQKVMDNNDGMTAVFGDTARGVQKIIDVEAKKKGITPIQIDPNHIVQLWANALVNADKEGFVDSAWDLIDKDKMQKQSSLKSLQELLEKDGIDANARLIAKHFWPDLKFTSPAQIRHELANLLESDPEEFQQQLEGFKNSEDYSAFGPGGLQAADKAALSDVNQAVGASKESLDDYYNDWTKNVAPKARQLQSKLLQTVKSGKPLKSEQLEELKSLFFDAGQGTISLADFEGRGSERLRNSILNLGVISANSRDDLASFLSGEGFSASEVDDHWAQRDNLIIDSMASSTISDLIKSIPKLQKILIKDAADEKARVLKKAIKDIGTATKETVGVAQKEKIKSDKELIRDKGDVKAGKVPTSEKKAKHSGINLRAESQRQQAYSSYWERDGGDGIDPEWLQQQAKAAISGKGDFSQEALNILSENATEEGVVPLEQVEEIKNHLQKAYMKIKKTLVTELKSSLMEDELREDLATIERDRLSAIRKVNQTIPKEQRKSKIKEIESKHLALNKAKRESARARLKELSNAIKEDKKNDLNTIKQEFGIANKELSGKSNVIKSWESNVKNAGVSGVKAASSISKDAMAGFRASIRESLRSLSKDAKTLIKESTRVGIKIGAHRSLGRMVDGIEDSLRLRTTPFEREDLQKIVAKLGILGSSENAGGKPLFSNRLLHFQKDNRAEVNKLLLNYGNYTSYYDMLMHNIDQPIRAAAQMSVLGHPIDGVGFRDLGEQLKRHARKAGELYGYGSEGKVSRTLPLSLSRLDKHVDFVSSGGHNIGSNTSMLHGLFLNFSSAVSLMNSLAKTIVTGDSLAYAAAVNSVKEGNGVFNYTKALVQYGSTIIHSLELTKEESRILGMSLETSASRPEEELIKAGMAQGKDLTPGQQRAAASQEKINQAFNLFTQHHPLTKKGEYLSRMLFTELLSAKEMGGKFREVLKIYGIKDADIDFMRKNAVTDSKGSYDLSSIMHTESGKKLLRARDAEAMRSIPKMSQNLRAQLSGNGMAMNLLRQIAYLKGTPLSESFNVLNSLRSPHISTGGKAGIVFSNIFTGVLLTILGNAMNGKKTKADHKTVKSVLTKMPIVGPIGEAAIDSLTTRDGYSSLGRTLMGPYSSSYDSLFGRSGVLSLLDKKRPLHLEDYLKSIDPVNPISHIPGVRVLWERWLHDEINSTFRK